MDEGESPDIICGQCPFQTNEVHYLVNHTKKKHNRKMSNDEIIAIEEEIAKLNYNNDTPIKNSIEQDVDDVFNNSNNISDETRPEQDDDEVVYNTNNNIPFEDSNHHEQEFDEDFNNNNGKNIPIENVHKLNQDDVIISGTETAEKLLHCDLCPSVFQNLQGLIIHKTHRHSTKNTYETLINSRQKYYKDGNADQTLTEFYQCDDCEYGNKSLKSLQVHKYCNHSPIREREQTNLTLNSEQEPIYNQHPELNSPKTETITQSTDYSLTTLLTEPIKCESCGFSTQYPRIMLVHRVKRHRFEKKQVKREQDNNSSSGMFHQCSLCSSKFSSKDGLNRHMKSIHTGRRLSKCGTCNEQFGSTSSMYRHIKKFHAGDPYPGRLHPELMMQEVAVKSQNSLTSHTRSNIQNGQDSSMNYSYNLANIILAHQSSARGLPTLYDCRYCDVRFMKINSLSQHEINAHGRQ